MANNFIQKYVAEQRTGANLVGIQVDTQSQYLLDRGSGAAMLSALEEIGKKADEAKIQNEKQNLLLSAEEQDLQFKKEVLSDPLLYKDEERYRKALIQFETNRKEKESKILKSEYLTPDEKKLMVRRIRNNDELTLVDMMEQKNIVYTQQQTDNILANIERRISIASELNINDIGGAEQTVEDLTKAVDEYQKLTLISDSQASIMLSDAIMRSEQGKFSNHINRILGSGLSLDQKRAKINNLLSVVKNDNLLTKMAESYASQIKYSRTDEEFKTSVEFFKSRINDVYENVGYTTQHHLESIQKQLEYDKKIKQAEYDQEIENAIFNKNPYKLAYYGSDKKLKPTFNQMLNNENGILEQFTDKTIADFGNIDAGIAFPFLTSPIVRDINDKINQKKKTGNYRDYSELYQPLYDIVTELAGNDELSPSKRRALIIDYGIRNNIDPTILIKGENNSEYFRIGNLMAEGNIITNEIGFIDQLSKIDLSSKARENFKILSSEFSTNEVLGDYLAANYILGYAKVNNRIDRLLERPDIELTNMLKNKNTMSTFIQDAKLAREFTSQRKDYNYIRLADPRIPKVKSTKVINSNNETPKNIENTQKDIKKEKKQFQNKLFGGRN